MTDDEKRQQKAMLLLEFQEAEQELAQLCEKAKRLSRNILAVSKWLEDRTHGYSVAGGGEDKVYVSESGGYVRISDNPEIDNAMDFKAAKALAGELKAARMRLQDLSERKKSLGLK